MQEVGAPRQSAILIVFQILTRSLDDTTQKLPTTRMTTMTTSKNRRRNLSREYRRCVADVRLRPLHDTVDQSRPSQGTVRRGLLTQRCDRIEQSRKQSLDGWQGCLT